MPSISLLWKYYVMVSYWTYIPNDRVNDIILSSPTVIIIFIARKAANAISQTPPAPI